MGAPKGKKFSEEHKRKIRLASIGRRLSEETKDKIRESKLKFKLSKKKLEELYTVNKLSCNKIAKGFSINWSTVRNALIRYDIPIRKRGQPKGTHFSKEHRRNIGLANKGKRLSRETKKKLSLSIKKAYLLKNKRDRLEQANTINKLEKNRMIKQILFGSLLGDGCLFKLCHAVKYQEPHSINQENYLKWKFKEFFNNNFFHIKLQHKKKVAWGNKRRVVKLYIRNNAYFRKVYPLFYPDGKKKISKKLLDQLDTLGLAVWYIDDGSYNFRDLSCRISTYCFSYKEHLIIKDWLMEKWSLNCKIQSFKTKGTTLYYVKFNKKACDRFLNLIEPEILRMPEEVHYKLGHLYEGNNENILKAKLKRVMKDRRRYKNVRDRDAKNKLVAGGMELR